MKKTAILFGALAMTLATPYAMAAKPYYDFARVVNVKPITKNVQIETPRQQCWDETVTHRRQRKNHNNSYTPQIFGAIVGAAVGRQFGRGRGQDVATAAGAVLGGSIGRDASNRNQRGHGQRSYQTVERRCETVQDVHTEYQVVGYRVTYKYHGNTFKTRLNYDPGHQLKVKVGVTPVG
ncbi:MAG: hypothetical protein ACI8P9_002064 [Parasphingorhabdus sp.]|jgi:uncharacterized protein YcfJ